MSLNSPVLAAQLRRHWQVVSAAAVLALFAVVHLLAFQPTAARFRATLKRVGDLGLVFEPSQPVPTMPPRVLALLAENALPASAAGMERESGALTAALLEDVTQLTTRHRMQVVATEPGLTSQEARAIQVRAHLRIQCSFADFVAFLDDMSRSSLLIAVDRLELVSYSPGRQTLDIWVTRYILKQTSSGRS